MCKGLHSFLQEWASRTNPTDVPKRRRAARLDTRGILFPVPSYSHAEWFAQGVEQELRNLKLWRSAPLPESAFNSNQAFFAAR